MSTHKVDLTILSLNQLETITGRPYRVLKARLSGLAPERTDGRTIYYRAPEALRKIFGADDQRARLDAARAELLEHQLGERRGQLVDVDAVADWMGRLISTAKQRLLVIPTKAASRLVGCTSPAQAKAVLEPMIDEALDELSADPFGYRKGGKGGVKQNRAERRVKK